MLATGGNGGGLSRISSSRRVADVLKRAPTSVQTATLVAAAVFLLVGILGFVPGITSHYGELKFAGHNSHAKLFGLFQVSVLHNLVHVVFGAIGVVQARTPKGGHAFLERGGVVALVLWLIGVTGAGKWIPTTSADNWLHVVAGVSMLAAGYLTTRNAEVVATA